MPRLDLTDRKAVEAAKKRAEKEASVAAAIAGGVALAKKLRGQAVLRGFGRVSLPLAAASGARDLSRAGVEGYRAFSASRSAKEEARASAEKYGTVDAATRTRRQRAEKKGRKLNHKADKTLYSNMNKEDY